MAIIVRVLRCEEVFLLSRAWLFDARVIQGWIFCTHYDGDREDKFLGAEQSLCIVTRRGRDMSGGSVP